MAHLATSHSMICVYVFNVPHFPLTSNWPILSVFHSLNASENQDDMLSTTVSVIRHSYSAGSFHGSWIGSPWVSRPWALIMFSFFILIVVTRMFHFTKIENSIHAYYVQVCYTSIKSLFFKKILCQFSFLKALSNQHIRRMSQTLHILILKKISFKIS